MGTLRVRVRVRVRAAMHSCVAELWHGKCPSSPRVNEVKTKACTPPECMRGHAQQLFQHLSSRCIARTGLGSQSSSLQDLFNA